MILDALKPEVFDYWDPEGFEHKFDLVNQEIMHSIQENYAGRDVRTLTQFEFLSLMDLQEKRYKELKKKNKLH